MNLNELQYGNPSVDILQYINGTSCLDALFAECSQLKFPPNDANIVKQELNEMITKTMQLHGDQQVLKRYQAYDRSLAGCYLKVTFEKQEDTTAYHDTLLSVFEDVLPLIFKLKQHFQRPRPFQLAHYFKIKLFPYHTASGDCPSYPCLHSCIGRVLAGVLSNHYPDASKWFNETGMDAGYSRVFMGLNFQSSVDAGIRVAEKILINREFQVKYSL